MKKSTLLTVCLLLAGPVVLLAQEQTTRKNNKWIKGLYFQWGYNVDAYSRSDIHFKMSNGDNFTLHSVRAHDSGDFDAIYKEPQQVSIPQYNYRIGFYINEKHSKAIEINFDHTKYIVTDGQTARVTGVINGQQVNGDSVLNPQTFLHFEHSDGANWLHINYVRLYEGLQNRARTRSLLKYLWKAGAGINIPRTDFTWKGERLNNKFHVAGYNMSAEGGVRFYPLKRLFIEATGKTGYVRYVNALANTPTSKGNRATHSFTYLEAIATLGFEVNL
ncbi:MAG: hypothetical protein DI535_12510 [Citrobacter freundii]|nr:MAG: hypothetical protein DI535_12510 [Citrobacter freundii]